jgi:thiosulfate dehydrogenase [quinone] large subunit
MSDCDGCGLDRRTFITQGMLAAAAVALAACAVSDITGPASINATIKLSDFPSLQNTGGMASLSLSSIPLAIIRTGPTTFVALSRICPHQGTTIDSTGSGFFCPRHGAAFDLNGQWTGGQRTSNLHSYPTTYDATAGTLKVG